MRLPTLTGAHIKRNPLYIKNFSKNLSIFEIYPLNLIEVLAEKEETDSISIATYALQLISQELSDKKLPIVCKEIISTGTFSRPLQHMPIPKSVFLLNLLEIGKRKYTELRHLCKSENFIFPSYNTISEYRSNVIQSNEFQSIKNPRDETIGIGISYSYTGVFYTTLFPGC